MKLNIRAFTIAMTNRRRNSLCRLLVLRRLFA